jgi:hypothetical protein
MTLEELKKEFTDQGFRIEGDSFIHEFEDPHTVINGTHPKKRFEMVYICEGSIRTTSDDSDSDGEPIYEFDILGQGRQPVSTICISCFEDFTVLVQ